MATHKLINDPQHWRERAAEMREMAGGVTDNEAKKAMLVIARQYQRLAERADQRSDGNPRGSLPPSK